MSRIQAGSLDYSYSRNAAGQVTGIEGLATPRVASGSESSTIDATNNQLAVRGGTSYSYDAAGRLLSDGVRTFSWDSLGRLRQVEANAVVLASYGYDSQNRRVRKTVGAKTTYYLYDLENRLIAEISGSGTVLREYIWLEQEPLALREYELRPGLYYYITTSTIIWARRSNWWTARVRLCGRRRICPLAKPSCGSAQCRTT